MGASPVFAISNASFLTDMFASSAFYSGGIESAIDDSEPLFFKDPDVKAFSPIDDPRNNTTSTFVSKGGYNNHLSKFSHVNENIYPENTDRLRNPFHNTRNSPGNVRNPFINRGNNKTNVFNVNNRTNLNQSTKMQGENNANNFNFNLRKSDFNTRSSFQNNIISNRVKPDMKIDSNPNSLSDSNSNSYVTRAERDSESSTYIESSPDEKFMRYQMKNDLIKSTIKMYDYSLSTPESVSTQRLIVSKKQMMMRSYFNSFKILSLLTLLLFLCPILSILSNLSCISTDGFCYPQFEVQTSGKIDDLNEQTLISPLSMKPFTKLKQGKKFNEEMYKVIEGFMGGLAVLILENPFDANLFRETLDKNLDNLDAQVTYRFSSSGYCKEVIDLREFISEVDDISENQCHLMLGSGGTDIPSVFIKDLTYQLSEEEIEGDPEYVSGLFQNAYRSFYRNFNISTMKATKYLLYGFSSIVLSQFNSYFSISELIIDIASVVLCVMVASYFKSQGNKSLLSFKNYLFDVNMKRQFSVEEQKQRFSLVQTFLAISVLFVWVSCILKIVSLTCTLIYAFQIQKTLNQIDFTVFEGMQVASSGTILELCNIALHIIVGVGLVACLIIKPWILRVDI